MKEQLQVSEAAHVNMLLKFKQNRTSNLNEHEEELLTSSIVGKSTEEIQEFLRESIETDKVVELLSVEPTADNGGIVALSGFYFQFLVSIEYLLELIEGKWDYLVIDHHQDIVVFNSEKIRFIQAKTKNQTHCQVSDIDLYRGWIQKLFCLDSLFVDSMPHKTEFEVVTNYLITNSKEVPVEIYYCNKDFFDPKVTRDKFFDKIEEHSGKKGYTEIQGDYLEQLLSRFKLTRKDTHHYIDTLQKRIGMLFNSRLSADKDDIDFIIGYMCSICYFPNSPNLQFIDKEKANELKILLQNRINKAARDYLSSQDSIAIIDRYINTLHDSFRGSVLYDSLETHINVFEGELKNYIANGGNIFSVVSRYMERCYYSARVTEYTQDTLMEVVRELLNLSFFIRLASAGNLKIDKEHKKLLIKEIGLNKFSLFNLSDVDNFEIGVRKLEDIISMFDYQEFNDLFNDKILQVFFSGDFDNHDFPPNKQYWEISNSNTPSHLELNQNIPEINSDREGSISKVTHKIAILSKSQSEISNFIRARRKYHDIQEYQLYLKEQLCLE